MIKSQQGKIAHISACSIGKDLYENTAYKILPSRTLFPEKYSNPPESVESKKSLLLSLSTMLSDSEKQRQYDSKLNENFTKCRVSKNKSKNAYYEYTDVNTGMVVTSEEYEKRYRNCIHELLYTSMLIYDDRCM